MCAAGVSIRSELGEQSRHEDYKLSRNRHQPYLECGVTLKARRTGKDMGSQHASAKQAHGNRVGAGLNLAPEPKNVTTITVKGCGGIVT